MTPNREVPISSEKAESEKRFTFEMSLPTLEKRILRPPAC